MTACLSDSPGGGLYAHQREAAAKLKSGMVLVGGVGSGKSRTALSHYLEKESPKPLYIITTARKRDTGEWEKECAATGATPARIDSWNNVAKRASTKGAHFIFDEQKVIGNGVWVKSFLRIAKSNSWVLLSATPGDTWMDYVPVFLANGFYASRAEFVRRHVVFSPFSKFPRIERYTEVSRLARLRDSIVVNMRYSRRAAVHEETVKVPHDEALFDKVARERWHVYEGRPIRDACELCHVLRRVVNGDPRRLDAVAGLLGKHPRLVVFYNFNYEREMLLGLGEKLNVPAAEWSGHAHQPIPSAESWLYVVQYAAGAEGWNCTDTNAVAFYSQSYSYKATVQAAGRIDRLNTPYPDLYCYFLRSDSSVDRAIQKAFSQKRDFNERRFAASQEKHGL